MGRPPLPLGTAGTIKTFTTEHGHEARCRFRDYDGVTRQLRAVGRTKGKATDALREKIRDRQGPSGSVITSETKLNVLATAWLAAPHSPEWSPNTRDTYEYVVKNQVRPGLGELRIREVKVAVIDRAIEAIRKSAGDGAAKTTKTVLSGMFKHAIKHEAIESNPVRDATSVPRNKSKARALTVEQSEKVVDGLRTSALAVTYDLPDLVEWMLYTGARIGEACAARAEVLDLEHGTWEVNATVVRIKGQGLVIQPRTKTEAGWRVLALPPGAVAMIERRRRELRLMGPDGVVFGAPAAKNLRDPRNTNKALRLALDSIGFEWVTSHTFRKTVATRLDEAGLSARVIADQLGHERPSMTQDVYMGRQVVNAAAASILDR